MRKELIHEMEVMGASADDMWAVYSSPQLSKLVMKLFSHVLANIDIVVEGQEGLGDVWLVTYLPGAIPPYYKKKCVTLDHKNRAIEFLHVEAGYLALGCTFFKDRFHILDNGCNSCIIKSTLTYEVTDELLCNVAPHISIKNHDALAKALSNYVLDKDAHCCVLLLSIYLVIKKNMAQTFSVISYMKYVNCYCH